MAKQQLNARISNLTRTQLDDLSQRWGTTQTETLTVIIDRMYQQETQTMSNETINYGELDRKYGTVNFEGKTYWLAAVADFSNNVFPGGYQGAEEGDAYTTEFSCPAYDADGDEYRVCWQFETVKGEEPGDLSNYPWDDEHIVEVRPE